MAAACGRGVRAAARRNHGVPGLVQLYSTLVAGALEEGHEPSREFFGERFAQLRRFLAGAARDEKLEVRDAEGVLDVHREEADAERVLGRGGDAVVLGVRPVAEPSLGRLEGPVQLRLPDGGQSRQQRNRLSGVAPQAAE